MRETTRRTVKELANVLAVQELGVHNNALYLCKIFPGVHLGKQTPIFQALSGLSNLICILFFAFFTLSPYP
jgi:hypothetical protein